MDLKLILVCYPAASLFLLIMTLQIAFGTSRERCTADRFLIAGLLSMFVGDALYMFAEIHLVSVPVNVLDLPYVIAFAGAATCALDPSMRTLTEPAEQARRGGPRAASRSSASPSSSRRFSSCRSGGIRRPNGWRCSRSSSS